MGAGASVPVPNANEIEEPVKTIHLKALPEAIEEALYVHEKFPLLIDPSEQASRFLKYQMGSFIRHDDPEQCQLSYQHRALVGALRYGRTLTMKFKELGDANKAKLFDPDLFPEAVLNRQEFYQPEVWGNVVKNEEEKDDIIISPEFVFCICTTTEDVPAELKTLMHVIRVTDGSSAANKGNAGEGGEGGAADPETAAMEGIASMLGGKEIVRNSTQLVEAAFDGDMEEMVSWIEKGYHIESCDGRKHTALSEASCQGHLHVVKYLLEAGADPNSVADNGRSALWRASFGGHIECVQELLEAGSDPQHRDKVSMESAFDVSRTEEIRAIFNSWSLEKTESLKAARRRAVMAKIEERIKTAADREFFARAKIREEILEKCEAGDVDGVREILAMSADEADKTEMKPRVTAEVRNEQGLSLLAIASKNDDEAMAQFLLTYWKECDKDRWDLAEGEVSVEAKTFKTNPNSRDLKGWNCCCIAVFHSSLKVLRMLLEHGGNPVMRSMYNKNAHDLAKDELDAANNVVTDRAHIREVISEYDTTAKSTLFGSSSVKAKGEGGMDLTELGKDGSPVAMQIEMNEEGGTGTAAAGSGGSGSGSGGGGGGKKGGDGKKGGGSAKKGGPASSAKKGGGKKK
jgi:ankyrin repeat protein